mmetsp:Transcript_73837/g.173376  ORF Transcript_73837/g.173376 Transcript_73837/m.173376 type:complete len:114 (-) Transcript_73837:23-364(-)
MWTTHPHRRSSSQSDTPFLQIESSFIGLRFQNKMRAVAALHHEIDSRIQARDVPPTPLVQGVPDLDTHTETAAVQGINVSIHHLDRWQSGTSERMVDGNRHDSPVGSQQETWF